MKIKNANDRPPTLVSLKQLHQGRTYRDHQTGHVWLATTGGFVDLTDNRIVTRVENMPGYDYGIDCPRYKTINCVIEIQED